MVLSASPGSPRDIHIVEEHIHNRERWIGRRAVPTATSFSDETLLSFQADSGNNAWGSPIHVLGSDDTPRISGMVLFDPHRMFVTDVERTSVYRIRLIWGVDSVIAEAAGAYTEFIFRANATNSDRQPIPVICDRLPVCTDLWAKVWCPDNTGTLDFFLGLHEYDE